MMIGFADQRLDPLGYARIWIWDLGLLISDLLIKKLSCSLGNKSEISNPKSAFDVVRTAGLEPASLD